MRFFRLLLATLLISVCAQFTLGQASAFTPSSTPFQRYILGSNESVYASHVHNDVLYVGGDFEFIGEQAGYMVFLDPVTGDRIPTTLPTANSSVSQVIPDGSGGWFVLGAFTNLDLELTGRLAHILPDGSVDTGWSVTWAGGSVSTIHLSGSILYLGGSFTSVHGQPRLRLAAVNASDGSLTSWDPSVNGGSVLTIAADGGIVYVGGSFTTLNTIGGAARNRIAAVDAVTGLATAWNPNALSTVNVITVGPSSVYVGGAFTTIASVTRNRIAEIDKITAAATSWNPGSSSSILKMILSGTDLFVRFGGTATVGGASRNSVAKLDTGSDTADAWSVSFSGGGAADIFLDGSNLYLGGSFTTVGGFPRRYAAKVDASTAAVDAWEPPFFDNTVSTIYAEPTRIFVGGNFIMAGGIQQHNLVAFDDQLNILPWDPIGPDNIGQIHGITSIGDTLYIVGSLYFEPTPGDFLYSGAAIDIPTATVLSWDPQINDMVWDIDTDGTVLYVAGDFSSAGGQPRNLVAAVDPIVGLATSWNPNITGSRAWAIQSDLANNLVYAGGDFTLVGGLPAVNLASIDLATGALVHDFNADADVNDLVKRGNDVIALGYFDFVSTQARPGFASISGSTLNAFAPNLESSGRSGVYDGDKLYVGGGFSTVDGSPRGNAAYFDSSLVLGSWDPGMGGFGSEVQTMQRIGDYLFVGGELRFSSDLSSFGRLIFFADAAVGFPPDAIGDLSVIPGDSEADLTWTEPADNGDAIFQYEVRYGETVGYPGNAVTDIVLAAGSNMTHTVTGLTNGTEYSFQVYAQNANGLSPASNLVMATPATISGRRRTPIELPQGPQVYLGRLQEIYEALQAAFGGFYGSAPETGNQVVYQSEDG